ncbi:MAG: nucleotidyl transferase AbiEii/AbiGii toxin family protein, partial [Sphaerochaetaceae bacterium]
GTALRIFHGLDRFSEDMHFSLQSKDPNFMLEKYLPTIEKELESYGFSLEARFKPKQHLSAVQSAFLKGNTLVHMVGILSLSPPVAGIPSNELMKIKIEIDTNPPKGATFEQKYKLLPQPYAVLLYDKPSLFAGKLHAMLCRNWRHREKGRDFYDYIWYLSEGIPVNIGHLEARMRQSGHWTETGPLQIQTVQELLLRRFENLDFQRVKRDVMPFIAHPASLDIWSREFFSAVTLEQLKG